MQPTPPTAPTAPTEMHHHASQPSVHRLSQQQIRAPVQPPQPPPFVDPAILSMGKRTSTAPISNQSVQEAPATPINPIAAASAAPVPRNAPPFVGQAKKHNIRKPSAATLEGPFSSLDIADAEEADSETKAAQPTVRRTSINKTRTGKSMDEPSPQKYDDAGKKTRRGGKSRKKELAAQERKNGLDTSDGVKKGYVEICYAYGSCYMCFTGSSLLTFEQQRKWLEEHTHPTGCATATESHTRCNWWQSCYCRCTCFEQEDPPTASFGGYERMGHGRRDRYPGYA